MFVVKRNQVIITALVIMIAVAGYLNYVDKAGIKPTQVALTEEGEVSALIPEGNVQDLQLSKATSEDLTLTGMEAFGEDLTTDDNPEIATSDTEESEPGQAVFVSSSESAPYFIEAKLGREQDRSKEKDILMALINSKELEQAKKAEAADNMLEIQQRIEKETASEDLLKAKGFGDVYVRMDDQTVDVVIGKEKLSEAEIAQIEDIVKRKTGMKTEQIRISTMKK